MTETNENMVMKTPPSKTELVKALELDFATTVNKAYVNSLDREVSLREVKVSEQKTLSRIMINNELRKDIIYDAQCSLINSVVLDEDFDVYKLTEFDKIKLLMIIYQSSMLKKEVNFTCKHCGTENSYNMDFQAAIERLNELDASDKEFTYSDDKRDFKFVVSYPKVSRVSMFYKQYIRTHKMSDKEKEKKQQETSINFEYVNLFLKSVTIKTKATNQEKTINFDDYGPLDIGDILAVFPYEIVYNDDGILKYISTEFIGKINEQFDAHYCVQCHEKYEEGVEDQQSFL